MLKHLINIGGTSTGLIIDKSILASLGLEEGSAVHLAIDPGTRSITIRPADENPGERREALAKASEKVMRKHRGAFKKLAKR